MLTSRRIEILKAIIDEFIDTAEPVGSKTLQQKYHLSYSSATIRNEMAALEAENYLEKPHTSAGRVPSNKAYQFYCEHLMEKSVDEDVKYAISNIFDQKSMNIEEAIKESCSIISEMTNLASGILGPDASKQTLEHIQLIPVDEKTAVCILITNVSHTEHKVFHFEEAISVDDIKKCTDIINDRLKGIPLSQLTERLTAIKPLLVEHVKRYEMLFNAFLGAFVKFASDTMYISGASNMMYQPEFNDIERVRSLISKINDSKMWRDLISDKNASDLALKTSDGTQMVWKDDLAVITNDIHVNDKADTVKLMVVGPKRMQYERIVSLMDFIGREIEKIYRK
ncbi:MAG: heat-inducible transcriptional repressor HrcA [Erysipelotrichaceae bacterium]|nr:heat-inducible transcriptional repressor HrcA [Erysipelotrichaceae bacterium]